MKTTSKFKIGDRVMLTEDKPFRAKFGALATVEDVIHGFQGSEWLEVTQIDSKANKQSDGEYLSRYFELIKKEWDEENNHGC